MTVYPFKYPQPFNIDTADIPETQTGSLNKIKKFNSQNSNLLIADIHGTQTSTLKKGIQTKRQTNPLSPAYNLLGAKELLKENNNPYGTTHNWRSKKNEIDNIVENDNQIQLQGKESSTVREDNNQIKHEGENINPNNDGNEGNENGGYTRPDPYYGYLHDKYVAVADTTGKNNKANTKKKKTENNMNMTGGSFNAKHNRSKSNGMNNTAYNFGTINKTFAQKLDGFIAK